MATLKDIAQEAGVSVKTVSRILNGENKEVWPSSVRRADEIRAIAKRIHFRPNATARTMRTNKTKLIGVLIRNSLDIVYSGPFNYEAILGIHSYLEHAGYEICLVHQSDMGKRSRIFREHMLDGVIVLGTMEDSLIDEIRNTFSACIWADANVDEPTRCVRRDEWQAGCLVGQAIAARGYQRVIWLGGAGEGHPAPHYSFVQRLAGLRHGLGLQLSDQLETCFLTRHNTLDLKRLLKYVDSQTVLVPYDTPQAQIALGMLTQQRLFPGQDVGIVCPDDSVFLLHVVSDLCRVSFDRMQLGKEAARLLLDQLSGIESPSVLLSGDWFEGGTLPKK